MRVNNVPPGLRRTCTPGRGAAGATLATA